MDNINIIEQWQKIFNEMKNAFKTCENEKDSKIMLAYFELNDTQIEIIKNLSKIAITGPQELKSYYTLAHLEYIKDELELLIIKDLKVKWINIDSAFNNSIKSGDIKHLFHIDIF